MANHTIHIKWGRRGELYKKPAMWMSAFRWGYIPAVKGIISAVLYYTRDML